MSKVGFAELIRGCPGRSLTRWVYFQFMRLMCGTWFKLFYRIRTEGRANLPLSGPVLIVANHQSFLDPIIIGIAIGKRPAHMLARKDLFKPFFMGWLLRSLNGVPVDRGHADIASMRRCIDLLKDGLSLAIFPEGTRTEDGSVGPFRGGTMLIARRAKATVLPIAITGSFEAWPRKRKVPYLLGRIGVRIGSPISPEELAAMDDAAALGRMEDAVKGLVKGSS